LAYVENNKLFSCPKCKMYGVLESGCKFMYCRCKENYCALCGKKLTERDHFNHFTGVPGATGPMGNVCVGMVPDRAGDVGGVSRKGRAKKRAEIVVPIPVPPPDLEIAIGENRPRTRGRGRRKAIEEDVGEEVEVEEEVEEEEVAPVVRRKRRRR
jgi:hypothetical protein